jgi:hypothetical protein
LTSVVNPNPETMLSALTTPMASRTGEPTMNHPVYPRPRRESVAIFQIKLHYCSRWVAVFLLDSYRLLFSLRSTGWPSIFCCLRVMEKVANAIGFLCNQHVIFQVFLCTPASVRAHSLRLRPGGTKHLKLGGDWPQRCFRPGASALTKRNFSERPVFRARKGCMWRAPRRASLQICRATFPNFPTDLVRLFTRSLRVMWARSSWCALSVATLRAVA